MLITVVARALDTNGNFGFKQQSTPDGYQQYVGAKFEVRPAYGSLETWKRSGFKYDESYAGKIFEIKEINVKDVKVNDKPNREISIQAIEVGGKKKIKFKAYEELTTKQTFWNVKHWPFIGNMPIILTDAFETYKRQHIGEIIEHDMIKDTYEIIDIFMGKGASKDSKIAEPNIIAKNTRTGETVSCPLSEAKTAPFTKALDGHYALSLVKVEKPEDTADRYGKTTTINDGGIDKYMYNDSVMSIIISGSSVGFSFVLENKSQHSIKIIWNEAAFVDLNGETSKIMHIGTKYIDREKDQPATTIIKGAKIDDVATPTRYVYFDNGYTIGYNTLGGGWKVRSILPKAYQGKEIGEVRLMLPIQIKDVINEYTFIFKVYFSFNHPELLKAKEL